MSDVPLGLAEQFDDLDQQRQAATLGMWTFLATEVMFFGGLFLSYIAYRTLYPTEFAQASRHALLTFGTINTAILLTSSLTMALAVRRAEQGRSGSIFLWLTIGLAMAFLGVKAGEYYLDLRSHLLPGRTFTPELPHAGEMFWVLYWAMTGLHALHVLIGLGLLSNLAFLSRRTVRIPGFERRVEIVGLYWHFVDIVWIFLYPLLYLVGRYS